MQMANSVVSGVLTTMLCAGCGGAGEVPARADGPGTETAAATTAPAPAEQDTPTGNVSFTIDTRPKDFGTFPDGQNAYTPLASTITARPSDGGREQLMITFLSMDLRKLEYPADLPARRAAGGSTNPLAAMASVGFSYRDETGREWAGPGRIRVEAFGKDGVLIGTFPEVSLPHTEKQLPGITMAAGEFRVRISAPW